MAAQYERGTPIQQTANNATSAVATQAGAVGKTHYITTLSASSDKAGGKVIVKDGTTVIWQDRISNTSGYSVEFTIPLKATSGASISATADGTAECNANFAGFTIDN